MSGSTAITLELILQAVVLAVISSVVTLAFPLVVEFVRTSRKRRKLGPTLLSRYLVYDNPHGECAHEWLEEYVDISQHWKGGLLLRSRGNRQRGDYVAQAHFRGEELLIGQWQHSASQAAGAGTFLLRIVPRGKCLYGYYSSRREDNSFVFVSWVLGETEADIEAAKRLLSTSTIVAEPEAKT